jgi:hypothetical protein
LHQGAKQTGVDKREEKNTDTGHPKKITELRTYFNFGAQFSLTMIILIKTKLIMVLKT